MARIIDSTQKNLVGARVKQLRTEKHLSQQQLSDKLETLAIYICRGSISRIEDGSRTVTDIELQGLSQVLATPIEEFFHIITILITIIHDFLTCIHLTKKRPYIFNISVKGSAIYFHILTECFFSQIFLPSISLEYKMSILVTLSIPAIYVPPLPL